jgi:hypothetical protein
MLPRPSAKNPRLSQDEAQTSLAFSFFNPTDNPSVEMLLPMAQMIKRKIQPNNKKQLTSREINCIIYTDKEKSIQTPKTANTSGIQEKSMLKPAEEIG